MQTIVVESVEVLRAWIRDAMPQSFRTYDISWVNPNEGYEVDLDRDGLANKIAEALLQKGGAA